MSGVVVGDDGLARPPWAATDPLLRAYYDTEWGLPVTDERGLYERITLEAFQAGLSWATILRKRPAFRAAFDGFDPDRVAAYDDADRARLMADAAIVRNRAKIDAAITNAGATLALREAGGLTTLVWSFQPVTTPAPHTVEEVPTRSPESLALSKALRARGFTFVGPTTMFALMEAIGVVDTHLVGSHRRGSSGVWSGAGPAASDKHGRARSWQQARGALAQEPGVELEDHDVFGHALATTSTVGEACRGDVRVVDFGAPVGHEQGSRRPTVVVSSGEWNRHAATRTEIEPSETNGLTETTSPAGTGRWTSSCSVPSKPPGAGR